MKQNICELDTMIFFREALEAHEFMLLPVMASAVVECRTADKELKTLNEDGEIGLARLFSIWANMMCAPGAATIVGCRPITMLSRFWRKSMRISPCIRYMIRKVWPSMWSCTT